MKKLLGAHWASFIFLVALLICIIKNDVPVKLTILIAALFIVETLKNELKKEED